MGSLDEMLAVIELSQHLISSSKTVRPIIPRGARCVEHVKIMSSAVCSLAPHIRFDYQLKKYFVKIMIICLIVTFFEKCCQANA